MSDGIYGALGFVSSILLNRVLDWYELGGSMSKAMLLGFAGALGGWLFKKTIDIIIKKAKIIIQKFKK